ncbi:hypothetical protein CD58_29150 [Pseudomonas brassicacearum]|nr:hypothetical protein CD58_29150 [Pseudomonas brassicacearum]
MAWAEKENKFLSLCGQRRVLQGQMANKNVLEGQLADVIQKIGIIESSGHAEVLSCFNSAITKNKAIKDFKGHFASLGDKLSKEIREAEGLAFDSSAFVATNHIDLELLERIGVMAQVYSEFKNKVSDLISGMNDRICEFDSWQSSSDFGKQQDIAIQQYASLVENLTQNGVDNPGQYQQLVETKASIEKKLGEIKGFESQEYQATVEINLIYADLIELRKSLTVRRREFVRQHLSSNDSISLSIEPLCNMEDMEDSFRTVIGRSDTAFSSDILDKEKETGFLHLLWSALMAEHNKVPAIPNDLTQIFACVHNFKTQVFNYSSGQIMGAPIGKRFLDFMAQLQQENFDRLNLWFPDDRLVVKFNDGKRLKDISQGSAGQKAATVLSFLLSYGNEPLILDQPEDDLDNGLISSLIVSKLQENKSRRQVIVVTHNPNIVVNGDSEYVVALQDKGCIEVAAAGGLQELAVRREVCEIMEGGKQALEQRYRRMIAV